ncbi:MAG: hypothetical protein HUU44_08175 [Ignavibacteriaceae bacterium]|nr:hypothetical protein [Ignavibacteriaceae bacterium]MEB2297922.1 hypothetical protein [Ignavibacteria bacterium]NUM62112.1 hypothetical protein [Ignavibacteriaceae bacterium]
MNTIEFKDYAPFIVALVALFTLLFGILQYRKGLVQRRSEQFLKMRERYIDNKEFQGLFTLIENDDEKLKTIPYKQKLKFLGFYEELALMKNSGLIKREVVFYMFAYHAIRIWQSENFWYITDNSGVAKVVNKESAYWFLFKKFAQEMIGYEKQFILKTKSHSKFFSKRLKFKL